ncbi:alanine racemase [Patescibacteria group bacterium]
MIAKQLQFINNYNKLEKKRCPYPTGILKVHLRQLEKNINKIKKFADKKAGKKLKFLLPVKGNGYGSGMIPISKFVGQKKLCDYLGVEHLQEAYELKKEGIKMPILILGQSFYTSEHIAYIVKNNIEQTVSDLKLLNELNTEAKKQNKIVKIHLNIDTGMGRLGILACDTSKFINNIKDCKNVRLAGVMTHFPVSDVPNSADTEYTKQQIADFNELKHAICGHAMACPYLNNILFHASNSGGTLEYEAGLFDMIRPGIATYGYPELYGNGLSLGLKPIMEITTQIALIKTYKKGASIGYGRTYTTKNGESIAIVPIGYADGLNRKLGNRMSKNSTKAIFVIPHLMRNPVSSANFKISGSRVKRGMTIFKQTATIIINGKNRQIAGRISMDQFSVIVDKKSKIGDKVVIIGKGNTARDIADQIGSIPYEVLCSFGNAKRLRHEWVY